MRTCSIVHHMNWFIYKNYSMYLENQFFSKHKKWQYCYWKRKLILEFKTYFDVSLINSISRVESRIYHNFLCLLTFLKPKWKEKERWIIEWCWCWMNWLLYFVDSENGISPDVVPIVLSLDCHYFYVILILFSTYFVVVSVVIVKQILSLLPL